MSGAPTTSPASTSSTPSMTSKISARSHKFYPRTLDRYSRFLDTRIQAAAGSGRIDTRLLSKALNRSTSCLIVDTNCGGTGRNANSNADLLSGPYRPTENRNPLLGGDVAPTTPPSSH